MVLFSYFKFFSKLEGQILKEFIECFKFVLGVMLILQNYVFDQIIDCFHCIFSFL